MYFYLSAINPFTAMLATVTLKTTIKSAKFETINAYFFSLFFFFFFLFISSHDHMKGFLSKCTVLKVDVVVPSTILFTGVYVCTFQPGNLIGWGSEGVKIPAEKGRGRNIGDILLFFLSEFHFTWRERGEDRERERERELELENFNSQRQLR